MNILMIGIIAILVCGIVGILVYLAYRFKRDKRAEHKPLSVSTDARDVNERIAAAGRRRSAAGVRSEQWRRLAAQHRVDAAESRVLELTKKDIQWKIWTFLRRPTTAAWTALFYILISSIGVIYSWAFYLRFEGVHIFDFFGTSDFLLSAFQSVEMLAIGFSVTLISLFIPLYRIYNFSICSVYKGERKGQERKERIKWEAAFLLSITCLFIFLVMLLWWNSPHLWQSWSEHPNLFFYLISLVTFVLLFYSFFNLFRSLIRIEQGARITWETVSLLSVTYLFIFLVMLLWWNSPHLWRNWSEHPNLFFYLISLATFVLLFYSIFKLFRSLIKIEQGSRITWEATFFQSITYLFIFLVMLLWWDWSEYFISLNMTILHLISIVILVPSAYCFFGLFRSPGGNEQEARITWGGRFLVVILLAESIFILPFLSGMDASKAALNGESPRLAKVTLRQDIPPPNIPLPDLTLFLGTTSGFHFFYECEKALKNENGLGETANGISSLQGQKTIQEKENTEDCQKSRPFIIPTANVSVLKFLDAPPHVGLPAVVAAIAELDAITIDLKSEKTDVTSAIIQINTITALFNRNSEVHTRLIIPRIEDLEPESIAHIGPDKIAEVVVAFQSYLEGKTPVTHLNETITTLNATIRTLNQADEPDPGLAKIAEEIKTPNPLKIETPDLKGIPDAIRSLNPLKVHTPDLKGIPDAIKNNTQEVAGAIKSSAQEIADAIKELKPEVQNQCAQGLREVANIRPFPKENHLLFEGTEKEADRKEKEERLDSLIRELHERFDNNQTLQQLVLIGRSDKVGLRRKKRKFYGSNDGLAQARAGWVRDRLKVRFPKYKGDIEKATILLSAGPLHIGEEVQDDKRALDRAVEVWACWTPKPKPEQAEASSQE